MQIKESDIRRMVRNAILSEVTKSRMGNLRTMKEEDCPYYREIPAKFAELFNSSTAQEFQSALTKKFPSISADLGIVGFSKNGLGIKRSLDPKNIGAISSSSNPAQILFGYFNSYLYATGFGCLQYYYLSLALDFLGTLLGVGDSPDRQQNLSDSKNNIGIKYLKGIEEKALELSKNSTGFINNFSFYVFPELSKKGANYSESDNIDLLELDIKNYQQKINEIRRIRAASIDDAYQEISKIMKIENTKYIRSIDLSSIDVDDIQLVEKFKKNAIADLIISFDKARLNYNDVYGSNLEFKKVLERFLKANG